MLGKKKNRPFVSVVVVAAGNASRMDGIDKQLVEIDGMPVVIRSILAFEHSNKVDEIIVVTKKESIPELNRQVREFFANKVKFIVAGGRTRQESVFCGVNCIDDRCKYIAIHDGARPLVLTGAIDACIEDAMVYGAALLGVKVKDTIKAIDKERFVEKTIDRENLFIAQTPQIFEISLYKQAMQQADENGTDFTDDCQLVESIGHKVYVSHGHYNNIKITTPDDISYAQALLEQMEDGI
ncbi:2-C-methyl-D-erythritol 4-phosphate cytidylyltransferase [Hydrogenoanaerobacterium saccharovorans]|uniref:2-C-methyl-D-erythritol 4-phosphate cytidylyltransferase n=1 Tax=Hydrogenoanaerobacterium saccharovorans TaxID=474960 RepID=A0A1H7ZD69_9FIRM|nr:2-C-methyl-D-erythritol 4-phosphate cytidylyltransferase [Hydrogenoanaerobacterium saccharovorans]RPF48694.1 2-C-methyl-D-erythritol 4-phosphate cytidylyltransferase [Hydrogenoanaerobacterium saccharovorans]SEM55934.1 2-C-methyl-D-erythritol 4-phosphate cytidylyltransferase [Hydrogenoanaerobacterium saccharovorans]